jgi:hypothetical protein
MLKIKAGKSAFIDLRSKDILRDINVHRYLIKLPIFLNVFINIALNVLGIFIQ